jgi:hypothetical protein
MTGQLPAFQGNAPVQLKDILKDANGQNLHAHAGLQKSFTFV